jgi:TonB-linked SusC/RagA family outer membrane protein
MTSPLRWLRATLIVGVALGGVCLVAPRARAQGTGTIRGRVTDALTDRPIDGVRVSVAGTELGTLTTADGRYQFNVRAGEVELRTRRVGYATVVHRITVTAGQTVDADFQLRGAAVGLDVVVVTGAGAETEKRKLGNSISTIDAGALRNAPVVNVSEQLAARDPAVSVLPSGGLTGEGAQIRIRAAASLTQSNEPVVYVDGVRVSRSGGFGDANWIGAGGGGTPSRLDDINPEAIDHIEILKGAAAASLYGTEASGGVIQIFIKKGSPGTPRWDFVTQQGLSTYPAGRYAPNAGWVQPDMFDTVRAKSLARGFHVPSVAELGAFYGQTLQPYQVIQQPFAAKLFETGYAGTYSASVSGGTPSVTYFVNGRYYYEDGPFGGKKLGPAADIDHKAQGSAALEVVPADLIKVHISTGYTDSHHETPNNNNNIYAPLTNAIFGHPELASCITPRAASSPTGTGDCTGPGNPFGVASFGTVREDMQRTNKQDTKHFIGSVNAAYQAFPSVSLEGTVGIDVVNQLSATYRPFGNDVDGFILVSPQGDKTVDDITTRIVTAEAKATWRRLFGPNWSSVFVAGGQGFIQRSQEEGSFGGAFPGPGLEVTSAGSNQVAFEKFGETVNAGVLAQEQLGYRDYAFLTVGGRYDRNSAFGKTSAGVFYPKASLSIIPSTMPGWESGPLTSKLSTFRVRAAIGQSGLQPGAFDKYTTFGALASELGPGLVTNNLGNPDLKPEVMTEWEVGTELAGFHDRAAIDITYWRHTTRDALYPRQYAPSGGFINLQITNIGEIKAGGYDITANLLPISQPNLAVKLFVNAAWSWAFVTKLGPAPPLKVGGSYPRYRNFVKEGYPIGALFGAALPGPCSERAAGATYLCLNPGDVPYDHGAILTGVPDGRMATEADLLAYLAQPPIRVNSKGNIVAYGFSLFNPLRVDRSGTGDYLGNYLGKSTPDWQGSFGVSATIFKNLELGALFEYKVGNYTITNLTDAFRKANPVIGRNLPQVAQAEATLMNPASTPQQRLDAVKQWAYQFKALSPYDGLNQNENGKFLRFRELSLTYNVPTEWAARIMGARYLTVTAAGRNLALWTPYSGVDPEINEYGRGGAAEDRAAIDQNFGQGIDAFGFALPRRFTFTVRMGF